MLIKLWRGLSLDTITDKKISQRLPALYLLNLVINLLNELYHLHQTGILHCDIKLENVIHDFITHKNHLIDYGLSLKMNEKKEASDTLRGSRNYLPPEIRMQGHDMIHTYNTKTEMYSLGVLLSELFGYVEMYDDHPPMETFRMGQVIKNPTLDQSIYDFVGRMRSQSPNKRPSFEEAITFFTLQKMHLGPEDMQLRVGLVTADTVDNMIESNSHPNTLLGNYSFVMLVDNKKRGPNEYMLLRHYLEKNNIFILDKALTNIDITQLKATEKQWLSATAPLFNSHYHYQFYNAATNEHLFIPLEDNKPLNNKHLNRN